MVSQIKVNEIIKQSGSSISIGESGDTVNIPSGATIANAGTATGFGDLKPSWYVRNATTTNNISSGTYHTLVFDTEDWDTDIAFASNAWTCPSGQAGKYLFNAVLVCTGLSAGKRWDTFFCQNGSRMNKCYYYNVAVGGNDDMYNNMSCIVDVTEGAAYTCQGYHNYGSDRSFDGSFSYFAGYKLLGV